MLEKEVDKLGKTPIVTNPNIVDKTTEQTVNRLLDKQEGADIIAAEHRKSRTATIITPEQMKDYFSSARIAALRKIPSRTQRRYEKKVADQINTKISHLVRRYFAHVEDVAKNRACDSGNPYDYHFIEFLKSDGSQGLMQSLNSEWRAWLKPQKDLRADVLDGLLLSRIVSLATDYVNNVNKQLSV